MSIFKSFYKNKNKIALRSKLSGSLSYKEVIDKSNIIKNCIPKKSLILLICENKVAPIICYISAIRNNSVIIFVDIKTKIGDIKKLISSYQPTHLCIPLRLNKYFGKYNSLLNIFDYQILRTNYKNNLKNNDLSILLPTSGSMGSPKFVRISKGNLSENTKSIIEYLKIKPNEIAITTMPFSYSYMLSIINTHLEAGASIVVTDFSIMQKQFWLEYKEKNVTSLSGVPYIYEIFLKLGLKNIFIKSLRLLTQAGGKIETNTSKKIIKFCKKHKIKFITMYGLTEASPRISYLAWKYAKNKIGSIGKSIPKTTMWIESEDGKKIIKPGQIGELIFKGKNVSLGYANSINDLNKDDDNKGVLKTGDLAYFDKDNFFYIQGRKNRIAKIFGNRVNLDEIEMKMKRKNFDIACKASTKKINIFYEKKLLKNKILFNLSKITGQNKIGFELINIKKIPRTKVGKIDYSNLEDY